MTDPQQRRAERPAREREREEEQRGERYSYDPLGGDDYPQSKKKLVPFFIAAGVGAVFLIVVIGGQFFASSSGQRVPSSKSVETVADRSAPAAPRVDGSGKGSDAAAVVPENVVPSEIDPKVLRQVKQATVYLSVNLPNGGVAEGSGFFALERGIVITNAHVLGMLRADSLLPRNVDVVIHSGEPGETKMTGTVLGVDHTNDLAVLRVEGDGGSLPAPLRVESAAKLTETQKVYIFGFPFGARLGKNITVSSSTVSSLRRGDDGALKEVQVNGGMHQGNSGGPVTDTRGAVIGVSVAIIAGTLINFAIPGEFVKRVVDGKIVHTEVGYAYRSGGETRLPVRLRCLDPMNRIREVKVDVWTGPGGAALPASSTAPEARPGDTPRQSFALAVKEGRYVGDVVIPDVFANRVVWIQPRSVNGSGVGLWEEAVAVPDESRNPLERRAAMIRFKMPTGPIERTLKLNSEVKATIFKGSSTLLLEDNLQGNVLETLQPMSEQRTRVRLVFGDCPYVSRIGETTVTHPVTAQSILRRHSPSFTLSENHACVAFSRHNFKDLRSDHRDAVNAMYQTICNAYEGTTLPLPNRTVEPQESWSARMPMAILRDGKATIQDIFLTCTYEGTSATGGRREALISLKGRVKGRKALAGVELGKVSGSARVALDNGFVSRVKLTTITEVENEGTDSRLLVHDVSTVERTEGNSLGLTPPAPDSDAGDNMDRGVAGGTMPRSDLVKKDLAALKGTWKSGELTSDGAEATGVLKLNISPDEGRPAGRLQMEIANTQGGKSSTTRSAYSFTLRMSDDTRLLVATGPRGTGGIFSYSLDGNRLTLSGRVQSRRLWYTLEKVVLRRTSATPTEVAGDESPKGGARGSRNAIKIKGDVYAFIQRAVDDNRLTDVDVRGYRLTRERYWDVLAQGGVLIGFEVGTGRVADAVVLKSWRPIFLTRTGEKFGKWHGKVPDTSTTIKARAGYVVSGMSVRTELGVNGFTLMFAKLGKTGLNMDDTYESKSIGGKQGTLSTIGGKGALFVGITGHLSNDKSPCSLGLVAVVP
jgi:S1-C subfamily serine protease